MLFKYDSLIIDILTFSVLKVEKSVLLPYVSLKWFKNPVSWLFGLIVNKYAIHIQFESDNTLTKLFVDDLCDYLPSLN